MRLESKIRTNYSGGATGADTHWKQIFSLYGVPTVDFLPEHLDRLSEERIQEVESVYNQTRANLDRPYMRATTYVGKLLRRDYLQARAADAILAISWILNPGESFPDSNGRAYPNTSGKQTVNGGTGYAVEMGIIMKKPVYVFDQKIDTWFIWSYENDCFEPSGIPPIHLFETVAGIGTRDLNDSGRRAIETVIAESLCL